LEDKDFSPAIYPLPNPGFVAQLPIENMFKTMPVSLKAEETLDLLMTAHFYMTDEDKTYTVQIRQGVAEVQGFAFGEPDIEIETTAQTWKEIAAKLRSPAAAILSGDLNVNAGRLKLIEFMGYFDLPELE
jgi:alkyl sulfatase BDS1-like metallo-beta-lactamase superfamily hydrolase